MATARVLIVDDAPDSANMLAKLLALTGAATQAITDATLALEAFATFHPQVVILDLGMPGIDGFELCRSIRAFPSADSVLIVIVSGRDDPADRRAAIEAGANYYFVKPADPTKLLELVKASAT